MWSSHNETEFFKGEFVLDRQIEDFCTSYSGAPYDYEFIRTVEDGLQERLNNTEWVSTETGRRKDGTIIDQYSIPSADGFGSRAENYVYNALVDMDIVDEPKNPNGPMKFPDYIAKNGTWIDSKAVICKSPKRKTGRWIPNYNSGLGDRDEILKTVEHLKTWRNHNSESSALIILTFYAIQNGYIELLYVKVVPELLYISVYKDLHDFQMKRVDRKTGEIKNANVQGRLTVRTYTDNNKSSAVYIDRLFDTVDNIRKREKR